MSRTTLRSLAVVCVSIAALGLASCGGGGSSQSGAPPTGGTPTPSPTPAPTATPTPTPAQIGGVAIYRYDGGSFLRNDGEFILSGPQVARVGLFRASMAFMDEGSGQAVEPTALLTQGVNVTGQTSGTERYQVASLTCSPDQSSGSFDAFLLFDRSGSISNSDANESVAAAQQLIPTFTAGDRGQVAEFSSQFRLLTSGFTSDQNTLLNALANLSSPGGNTALWDSIIEAADAFSVNNQRRAIITFSDGEDTISSSSSSGALDAMRANGVGHYSVNLKNANSGELDELATATGGWAYSTSEVSDLSRYYRTLAAILRGPPQICFTEVAVSFEPNGSADVGYGPYPTRKQRMEFEYTRGGSRFVAVGEIPLHTLGGRIGTIRPEGKAVYSSSLPDSNCSVSGSGNNLVNRCNADFTVYACNAAISGQCAFQELASGESVPLPYNSISYISCPTAPSGVRTSLLAVAGSPPNVEFTNIWDGQGQAACVQQEGLFTRGLFVLDIGNGWRQYQE